MVRHLKGHFGANRFQPVPTGANQCQPVLMGRIGKGRGARGEASKVQSPKSKAQSPKPGGSVSGGVPEGAALGANRRQPVTLDRGDEGRADRGARLILN